MAVFVPIKRPTDRLRSDYRYVTWELWSGSKPWDNMGNSTASVLFKKKNINRCHCCACPLLVRVWADLSLLIPDHGEDVLLGFGPHDTLQPSVSPPFRDHHMWRVGRTLGWWWYFEVWQRCKWRSVWQSWLLFPPGVLLYVQESLRHIRVWIPIHCTNACGLRPLLILKSTPWGFPSGPRYSIYNDWAYVSSCPFQHWFNMRTFHTPIEVPSQSLRDDLTALVAYFSLPSARNVPGGVCGRCYSMLRLIRLVGISALFHRSPGFGLIRLVEPIFSHIWYSTCCLIMSAWTLVPGRCSRLGKLSPKCRVN